MKQLGVLVSMLAIASLMYFFTQNNLKTEDQSNIRLGGNGRFQEWAIQFAKIYTNQQQKMFRIQKFYQNYQFVLHHNLKYKLGQQTFEVGLNQFADMDNHEFSSLYLQNSEISATSECNGTVKILEQLPPSQDWGVRAVSLVKNQGLCTAAWAFAAVGAIQGLASLTKSITYNFSAQQLIDCSSQKYGNQGCNGGQIQNSFWYVIDNGITTQQKYPYVGQAQPCNYTADKKVFEVAKCAKVKPNSSKALASALIQQPVAVTVDSSSLAFQLYRRGVFSGKCGTNPNHGMVLTGYGTLDELPYWKCKNSWGLTWGQEGFIFMARTKEQNVPGQCGILMKSSIPLD